MNSKLKAGVILVIIFAIGALAGTAGNRLMRDHHPRRTQSNDPFRKDPEIVTRIEQRLVDHYDLTEEQALAVRQILIDSQKKYDDFFHKTRPTFERIRREQRDSIRALMSPDQLEKFDKWMEEHRKRGPRLGGPRLEGERRRPNGHPSTEDSSN